MAIEYLGLSEINGPMIVVEGVKGAFYDEIVEFGVEGADTKLGRIVEINEDKAVIQVFESTAEMSLLNTRTRLTGHPMEIGLSEDILGRTFNGLGEPIDGLGAVRVEEKRDVNGLPMNPCTREYPRNYIRTGISAIDGLTTLIRGRNCRFFPETVSHTMSWRLRSWSRQVLVTIPTRTENLRSCLLPWASNTTWRNILSARLRSAVPVHMWQCF